MREYVENKTKEIVQKFNEIVEANLDAFMFLNKISVEDFQKNGVIKNYLAAYIGDSSYKQISYMGKEIFKTTITVTGIDVKIETIWN